MKRSERLAGELTKLEDALPLAGERLAAAERLRDAALQNDEEDPESLAKARAQVIDARERLEEAGRRIELKRQAMASAQAAEAADAEREALKELERVSAEVIKEGEQLLKLLGPVGESFARLMNAMDMLRVDAECDQLPLAWSDQGIARLIAVELSRRSDGLFPHEMSFALDKAFLTDTVTSTVQQVTDTRRARGVARLGQ